MGQKLIASIIVVLISLFVLPTTQYNQSEMQDAAPRVYLAEGSVDLTIVDSLDNVGDQSDLALDSENNVHISYRDVTNKNLKYAFFDGTSWNITTVDDDGNVGQSSSIVIDSNDYIHICYFDNTNSALKYAFFDGTSWNITTVGNMFHAHGALSMGIDSHDKLHVAYHATEYNLSYATYDGEVWDSNIITYGSVYTVDLIVDSNDNIHTVTPSSRHGFYDGNNWTFTQVNDRGYYNSMAVAENGNIFISYSPGSDWHGHYIEVTMFDGNNWSNLPPPPGFSLDDNVDAWSSLTTDSNGNPHLVYYTGCGDYYSWWCDVNYAVYNGTDWQSYAIDEEVRENGRTGTTGLSMIIDSEDYVHISYKNLLNNDLMYAKTIVDLDEDDARDKYDACIGIYGTSQHDRAGCPDSDGDGYSDADANWSIANGADAFVDEPTQWIDLDEDGYGDNPEGVSPDMFPQNPDWWLDMDRDGIEDSLDDDVDGDGVLNVDDVWPTDFTKSLDTDGDGFANFVQGLTEGQLIDFESGNYNDVNMHCATDFEGLCMPDYSPWIITNDSISGSYSLEQQLWASDTGHFSISFSSASDDVVTLQVYITDVIFENQCIPIYLDGASIDYGCAIEGFGYYDNITINVTEGDHELKIYGTILGSGNLVDNIQLPDYVMSYNEDTDDDNDGVLDEHELSFDIDSPCRSDPLDANSTPHNNSVINSIENFHSVSYWWGSCEVYLDSDGDGIMDWEDSCPDSFGDLGYESETPGCSSESDEEMNSSSDKDSSLVLGIGIGVIVVILLVVFFVRRNGKSFQEGSVNLENELQEDNPLIETSNSSDLFSETPPENATGMLNEDGYYWLEWPIASGKWHYRVPDETIWNYFEK